MKKRILSLLLCLCLISSTAVLFASCGKKTVELAGYGVVYGADFSDSADAGVKSFANVLAQKTDGDVGVVEVKSDAELTDEAKYEILIGNTNRPESAKALKKIKGHGYVIKATGGKIVIIGTTNLLTSIALDVFTNTYLTGEGSIGEIEVVKTEVEELEMLEITNKWTFVYSQYLDGAADAVNVLIETAKGTLSDFSSIRGASMKNISDLETASQEILVGMVDREECRAVTSGMNANDYGVAAKNGKLIVAALNDSMTDKAVALMSDALRDSVCKSEEDGKETRSVFVPADFALIYTAADTGMMLDFPKPEGLSVSGTVDVYDSSTEYFYEGDAVNMDAYYNYCKKLVAEGYRLYGVENLVEGSAFSTYVNESANVTLYVGYNAFKYASSEETEHKRTLRVVASPFNCVNLMEENLFAQDLSYERLQDSAITSINMTYDSSSAFGSFYVIALEDGSFIVVDGGITGVVDCDKLYNVLLNYYRSARHCTLEPTDEDPIRIAAWYLTRGHADHKDSMRAFIDKYCAQYSDYYVTIDRLIANFSSDEENYNSNNPGVTVRDSLAELSAKVSDTPGKDQGFKYYKVHTGQRFWFANVELEVMYTHEDVYPQRIHYYNDTSTVIRMNMCHTRLKAVSAGSETSMLWLGDAQELASQWMRAMYGEYIQSDMVQVANNGNVGCEWLLYKLIKPECAWWPASRNSYKAHSHNSAASSEYYERVNNNINYNLKTLKYIILGDVACYTVTLTSGGFDFENIEAYVLGTLGSQTPSWATLKDFAGAATPTTALVKTDNAT